MTESQEPHSELEATITLLEQAIADAKKAMQQFWEAWEASRRR